MKKIKKSIFEKSLEQTFNEYVTQPPEEESGCHFSPPFITECKCHQPKEVSACCGARKAKCPHGEIVTKDRVLDECSPEHRFINGHCSNCNKAFIPSVESNLDTSPEGNINNKPYKTCLNINCPERTGGVCNAGESVSENWEEMKERLQTEFYKFIRHISSFEEVSIWWLSKISLLLSQAQSEHNQDCTREEWARARERERIVKIITDSLKMPRIRNSEELNELINVHNEALQDIINLITNQ